MGSCLMQTRSISFSRIEEARPSPNIIRSSNFDLAARLDIALALATVLEGVHRQHIVHKDINPSNVLVDLDGRRHVNRLQYFDAAGGRPLARVPSQQASRDVGLSFS